MSEWHHKLTSKGDHCLGQGNRLSFALMFIFNCFCELGYPINAPYGQTYQCRFRVN